LPPFCLPNLKPAPFFLAEIAAAGICRLSAANFVEAGIVVRRDASGARKRAFDELMRTFQIQIEPVTQEQAVIALDAYEKFGKGSGHPASLNYGDSFAYALAKQFGEPLLFKGEDFIHTDISPACLAGRPAP
jgi:ribonuclease VapC